MDWESLLDELWHYAESDPDTLESKIRSCLKGYSSDGILQAISLLIAQNQHAPAKSLLSEFLKSHQASSEIQRRLELILLFRRNREPQTVSVKSKHQTKETLLKEVNELVAAGKLQAAESLLREAVATNEDVDYLDLLSRVLLLQHRTLDSAKAMQRALTLRREQQAFMAAPDALNLEGIPTADDLAFIGESATGLAGLDESSVSEPPITVFPTDISIEYDLTPDAANDLPQDEPGWWRSGPDYVFVEADEGPPGEEPPEAASRPQNGTLKLKRPRQAPPGNDGAVRIISKSKRWVPTVDRTKSELLEPTCDPDIPPVTRSEVTPPSMREGLLSVDIDDATTDSGTSEASELDLEVVIPSDAELRESGLDVPIDDTYLDDDALDLSSIDLDAGMDESNDTVADYLDLEDDYAAYAFDPDDVFDSRASETEEPNEWFTDRLSREDRALQKAAELIGNANWPLSALPLVQQIFIMNGWGATRLALEREIEKGLTPDELILATHLKVAWAENDMYWIAFDKTGSSRLSHEVISWPTALLIVRSFESLPQVEEVEVLLERLFAAWYENTTLRRAFKAFARYLWFRFANLEGCLPANQQFDFCDPREFAAEEYSDLGLSDFQEIRKAEILRDYGVPQTKQPQARSCYFSDLPPREEKPSINTEARSAGHQVDAADDGDDEEDEQRIPDNLMDESVMLMDSETAETCVELIHIKDYA